MLRVQARPSSSDSAAELDLAGWRISSDVINPEYDITSDLSLLPQLVKTSLNCRGTTE